MTSSEQFEAWFQDRYAGLLEESYFKLVWVVALESWQASREAVAVAVELPDKKFISEDEALIPEDSDWPDGFNTALKQCAEAIRAAGIKVKGE